VERRCYQISRAIPKSASAGERFSVAVRPGALGNDVDLEGERIDESPQRGCLGVYAGEGQSWVECSPPRQEPEQTCIDLSACDVVLTCGNVR
jgi:hypothetical protein